MSVVILMFIQLEIKIIKCLNFISSFINIANDFIFMEFFKPIQKNLKYQEFKLNQFRTFMRPLHATFILGKVD